MAGADGLGNPRKNALPRCQLKRLRDYATTVYRKHCSKISAPASETTLTPAIWMDTLCIPVDTSATEYRRKAISFISKTFKEATVVLILDR